MHMLRKLSLGWAAQTAIQSRSHPFQSAPFWDTWAVGNRTASQPAACMCMQFYVSDTERTLPLLMSVILDSADLHMRQGHVLMPSLERARACSAEAILRSLQSVSMWLVM